MIREGRPAEAPAVLLDGSLPFPSPSRTTATCPSTGRGACRPLQPGPVRARTESPRPQITAGYTHPDIPPLTIGGKTLIALFISSQSSDLFKSGYRSNNAE